LTNHAYNNNHILVFGGKQERPNLHIEDMTDLYCLLLELPDEKIAGKTYNAGYQNRSVADIAEIVRKVMAEEFPERPEVTVETRHSDDIRSYRISSEKIKRELNFVPKHTIEDAVRDLIKAFKEGKFTDSLNSARYFNIKTLKTAESQCAV
jgi:nucleoside-diphosphate-sugar epimerase